MPLTNTKELLNTELLLSHFTKYIQDKIDDRFTPPVGEGPEAIITYMAKYHTVKCPSCLHVAAARSFEYAGLLSALLKETPDVNVENSNGLTAFHMMLLGCIKNNEPLEHLELFLWEGRTDINATIRTEGDMTPLMLAVSKNKIEIVKMLVQEQRIEINKLSTEFNSTALHYAVAKGNAAMTEVLLSVPGIRIDLKDAQGKTALDYAQKNEDTQRERDSRSDGVYRKQATYDTTEKDVYKTLALLEAYQKRIASSATGSMSLTAFGSASTTSELTSTSSVIVQDNKI